MSTFTSPLPAVTDAGLVIDRPRMFQPYRVAPSVDVLPAYLPVPGMGVLPANSFVIHGDEPVLVDSGPGGLGGEFADALRQVIDPSALRWLWLTHADPDHVGGLSWLLDAAPQMRVITTYLAVGKLGMTSQPVPLERCWFANPGDTVHVGDRKLLAVAPPSFDAPETTACFDTATSTLFSADMFGALMAAPAPTAHDVPAPERVEGMVLWSTIDAPWLRDVDRAAYERALGRIRDLSPTTVLSAHLPPAGHLLDELLSTMRVVPEAPRWRGPDQADLEAMLAQTSS
jgi:hypothetical protein